MKTRGPPQARAGGPRAAQVGLPGPGGDTDRTDALEELALEIRACRRCPLGETRSQAVVYRGDPRPRVIFVGEAPGAEEDRQGIPFVGRSGKILDRAIGELGPDLGGYGVLNVLKCRPPENRFDPNAARTCRTHLDRQLDLLCPDVLVTLGAQALRALAPEAPAILKSAGSPLETPRGPLFPLVHPAASLRSRRLAERWTTDVGRLGVWLRAQRRERP